MLRGQQLGKMRIGSDENRLHLIQCFSQQSPSGGKRKRMSKELVKGECCGEGRDEPRGNSVTEQGKMKCLKLLVELFAAGW